MDLLFSQLELWQATEAWGSVLDAGTGRHSLRWICTRETSRWTAVTGDPMRAKALAKEFSGRMKTTDRIIHGNWSNLDLLANETFDTVLADYLIGAIDGFAPYYQDQVFSRLRPMVKKTLYVIGMEPLARQSRDAGAKLIIQIANLRDACILLAGHRCFREYPLEWIKRNLKASSSEIENSKLIPIRFGLKFTNGQLDVCERKLSFFANPSLKREIQYEIDTLRGETMKHIKENGPISFGHDHVVKATIKHRS